MHVQSDVGLVFGTCRWLMDALFHVLFLEVPGRLVSYKYLGTDIYYYCYSMACY